MKMQKKKMGGGGGFGGRVVGSQDGYERKNEELKFL